MQSYFAEFINLSIRIFLKNQPTHGSKFTEISKYPDFFLTFLKNSLTRLNSLTFVKKSRSDQHLSWSSRSVRSAKFPGFQKNSLTFQVLEIPDFSGFSRTFSTLQHYFLKFSRHILQMKNKNQEPFREMNRLSSRLNNFPFRTLVFI